MRTTTLRATDAPLGAIAWRRVCSTLTTACPCSIDRCQTIGQHIWQATRDGRAAGLRASTYDPKVKTSGTTTTTPAPLDLDKTSHDHRRYCELVLRIDRDMRDLATLVDNWRPDRTATTPDGADPADWCRHHLDTISTFEPRYRGDQCRRCYDFNLAVGVPPPLEILETWHRGGTVTQQRIAEISKAVKAAAKKKKRRKGKR